MINIFLNIITYFFGFFFWAIGTALFIIYSQHLRHKKPYDSILPPVEQGATPLSRGFNYENISFVTVDRLTIHAWYVPPPDKDLQNAKSPPVIIALHGGLDDRRYYLPLLPAINNAGFAMLMLDGRNHGASDFDPRGMTTIGIREARDLLAALDFIEQNKQHDKVGIVGVSSGSAAAIAITSSDRRVSAVVAESSGYNVKFVAQRLYRWIPIWISYFFGTVLMLLVGAGLKNALRCRGPQLDLVKKIPDNVPVLFVHGRKDKIAPLKYVQHLYGAKRGEKELVIYDDARHAVIRFEEYKFIECVSRFFNERLS
ncbi:alpha/beta hydrolase [Microbulbifer sp. 2205BS26-8]|uniref:alpha/beta hydrolase n=1 Tax=Microbulbifer sp. 2205BS26-8 TaxID=3064386 RepID=UPI00273F1283|nr:alpha/beta fold hydrolase [Microbulbifer sp. 2205BS26-8]MDP5209274.1 alpha/beta fold hydrolase [Microbulbifer sp. 2205BS26-8]